MNMNRKKKLSNRQQQKNSVYWEKERKKRKKYPRKKSGIRFWRWNKAPVKYCFACKLKWNVYCLNVCMYVCRNSSGGERIRSSKWKPQTDWVTLCRWIVTLPMTDLFGLVWAFYLSWKSRLHAYTISRLTLDPPSPWSVACMVSKFVWIVKWM